MEDEIPFFTKSKEKFETNTIEAWGMLRKHYIGLKGLSARDMPDGKYKRLWDYEQYLVRTIKRLEEIPSLMIIAEEEKKVSLVDKPCNPIQYLGPCEAIIKTIEDPTGCGS
jgi:hypothetical protein